MVGDNLRHDVEGAIRVGMRAVLLHRSDTPPPALADDLGVPVIRSLRELPNLVIGDRVIW